MASWQKAVLQFLFDGSALWQMGKCHNGLALKIPFISLYLFRPESLSRLLNHWSVKLVVSPALSLLGRQDRALCLGGSLHHLGKYDEVHAQLPSRVPGVHPGEISFLRLFPGFLPQCSLSWCYAEMTPRLDELALV